MRDTITMMLDADRYEIDQLIRPIANIYRISANGQPVAFVRQKKLAIKEDIRFFADENEARELFRIKARAVFELSGRYDVVAAEGDRIGVLEKHFTRSLLRSTWRVLDPAEAEIAVAQERSAPVALFRRAVEMIPYLDLIPIVFHFTIDAGEEHLGDLTRAWGVRDKYTLDLSADTAGRIDRRLGVALAIALDALQSR
jgi:uncharacterized protein YxjI